MKSIKLKITLSIIICSLISSAFIGSMSISNARNMSNSAAERELVLTCANTAADVNALISRVEQSVDTLSEIAMERLDFSKMPNNDQYVEQYTAELMDEFYNFAEHTDGAITAYIRYNPDFTDPTSGIFLSRQDVNSSFESIEPTDFSIYEKDDLTHVGWYYIPVENKAPIWMDPYLNENINIYMISYVVPLYVNGTSVGIIGMDIDFNRITGISDAVTVFDDGYAFLTGSNGTVIHHKDLENGTVLNEYNNGELAPVARFLADESNQSSSILEYTLNGKAYSMAYSVLDNGMRLSLTATAGEIRQNANALSLQIVGFFLLGLVIAAVLGVLIGSNIATPIKKLTLVIQQTAQLNFRQVELDDKLVQRRDETGTMAKAISEMRGVLRNLISGMEQIKGNLDDNMERLDDVMQENNRIAEDNSSTTEELAAGIQEVAESSARILGNINAIQENVSGIKRLSEQGQTESGEIKSRARQLSETTAASSDKTLEIYRSMQDKTAVAIEQSKVVAKINELTEAIREISSQTNLLALNANIEAARAGEAGRGFAVVATEIGSLANQTFQTVDSINEIVLDVNTAVTNMTECIEQIMEFLEKTVVVDYDSFKNVGVRYESDANVFSQNMEGIYGEIAQLSKWVEEIVSAIDNVREMISQSAEGVGLIADKSSDAAVKTSEGYNNLRENKDKLKALGELIDRFGL
ncbi:MAG: methyl-accepting chemotaxis protein [Butyrivibrio sp.]|nr:methyl-accepting chemotaxis protein [Muribaculum sp.]MCM1551426.1 methyl-accepting chemotaxis protein [Butyrivibrio sp.]